MKLELKPDSLKVFQGHGLSATHAGTSKDCQISWIYDDSVLEVFSSQTNEILASWRFGKICRDVHTTIKCVKDFKIHGGYLLLVAISNSTDVGQLCLFSIGLRKVLQVIEVPQKITALEILFSNTGEDIPKWILSKHLQFFCGLAAVGTEGGYVYLIDLCLDRLMLQPSTEDRPRKLMIISPCVVDSDAKRIQAISYNKHIAVLLDEQCHNQGQYYYRRQDDTVQKVIEEDLVQVTALKYLEQAGILAVGFNFGCFQLWKLYNPVLDYSSRFATQSIEVSNFVVQEPENDPRNFLYLWVVHDEDSEESIASACLYQLSFTKKEMYAGFGLFYDELESVCQRMDHKLTIDPYSKDTRCTWSSSLVTCFTIQNPFYTPPSILSDSFEEGLYSNDLSLSIFVWKAESKQGNNDTRYWMSVFDLNRWYHAQMPHSIRCIGNSLQVCSYWAVYSLDDVVAQSPSHSLLNVEVSGDKVLRFINNSPLPPEEHSFPSSLQFTSVRFITADSFIQGRCDGWQGQLLRDFLQNGVEYLVCPADFYHQCLRARLLPQSYLDEQIKGPEYQRQVLLNMALEHGLACTLISDCIQQWADGEFTEQGCSLTMLLNWAWQRVVSIKDSWHLTCEVLFDNSGHQIDARTDWQLKSLTNSLTQLKKIFSLLLALSGPTTEKGQQELEIRLDTISILLMHFEIVRWCVFVRLLPEIEGNADNASDLFVYPKSELDGIYLKRRSELSSKKGILDKMNLLLIDELVDCQGPVIKNLWKSFGGDGFYPPPNIQSVVNMYLIDDITPELKNAITLYFLQDLANLDKTEAGRSSLGSFVERFSLSHSMVHQVQGLWFIDHKDFEEGVRHLVNPTVHEELCCNWKHIAIVNTLFAQSEGLAATRFLHTKCVLNGSVQEQHLYISVLITNKQLNQALEYMRNCQNEKNFADLMNHLLNECQKNKLLGHLLQHHLTEKEETLLEQYLRKKGESSALEPLFLYYLHHSRFLQAFQLNEDMKRMDKMEASANSYDRAIIRNRLMDAYLRVLPEATKKLLLENKKSSVSNVKRFEYERPRPLSTVVRSVDHTAMSRSNFIMALMDKVQEAKEFCPETQKAEAEVISQVSAIETDVPLLKTPRPVRSTALRASDIIYPELNQSPLPMNPLSVIKRKALMLENENLNGNVSLHQLTMECLQILQTPTKSQLKKSPSGPRCSLYIKTPQSILKVRNLSKSHLQTSNEHSTSKRLSGSLTKKFGFSKLSPSLPSPSQQVIEEKDLIGTPTLPLSKLAAQTPKQLRFVGISPSPTPSPTMMTDKLQESIRLRDTSVTPPLIREDSVTPPPEDIQGDSQPLSCEASMSDDSVIMDVNDHDVITNTVDVPSAIETNQEETSLKLAEVFEEENTISISVTSPELSVETDNHDIHHLVRPDLHPSWQQESLNPAQSETAIDEEITFHASSSVNKNYVANMTSSPIESVELIAPEITCVTADDEEDNIIQISVNKIEYEKRLQRVGPSLKKAFAKTVTESKVVNKTVKENSCVDTSSVVEQVSQTTSTSLTSTLSVNTGSPERTIEQQRIHDSPPATPPLSKKAKLMVKRSKDTEVEQFSYHTVEDEPQRRKTPERKSPTRRTKLSSDKEAASALEALDSSSSKSPPRNRRKTPDRKSPSRSDYLLTEADDLQSMKQVQAISPLRNLRKNAERMSPARVESHQKADLETIQPVDPTGRKRRKSSANTLLAEHTLGGSRESTPDRTILRRSTRLKTPDLSAKDSPLKEIEPRAKTPLRISQSIPEYSESDTTNKTKSLRRRTLIKERNADPISEPEDKRTKIKNEEIMEEEPIVRRSMRRSKTPERISKEVAETVTPTRRSKRKLKSPEQEVSEIEPVASSADIDEIAKPELKSVTPSTPTRMSSRRQQPLVESSIIDEPAISKRPTRSQKFPDLMSVESDELSEDPLASSKKSLRNQKSPSKVINSSEVMLTPSRKSTRTQKSSDKQDIVKSEHFPDTAKSKHKLRSLERSNMSQTELLAQHSVSDRRQIETSPNDFEAQPQINSMNRSRRASSVELNPPRHNSFRRGRSAEPGMSAKGLLEKKINLNTRRQLKLGTAADDLNDEQMPPLRLEIDEESSSDELEPEEENFTITKNLKKPDTTEKPNTTESTIAHIEKHSIDVENPLSHTAIKNFSKELSPSFIFSPPLKHSFKKTEENVNTLPNKGKEIDLDVQKHTFVFSQPTVAADNESVEVNQKEKSSNNRTEYDQPANPEPKSKRKRRTLFDGSPLLLSPVSPLANRISQRQPSESQRLSASILRRYKPRPRSRRLQPSQTSSRQ